MIEILMVATIIGVLTILAMPQLAMYRQKGFNASAISDLKQLRLSLETYYAEKQGYP